MIDDTKSARPPKEVLDARQLAHWLSNGGLCGETALDLMDWGGKNWNVDIIASVPELAQVESLSLSFHKFTPEEIRTLFSSPFLVNLRYVEFWSCHIGADGIKALASAPITASLTALHLGHCHIGDDGMLALAFSPSFSNIEKLYLEFNDLTDRSMHYLASSPYLINLKFITLNYNNIGYEGFIALSSSHSSMRIERLHAHDLHLDARSVQCICDAPIFSDLKLLALSEIEDGSLGIHYISSSRCFTTLEMLAYQHSGLKSSAAIELANSHNIVHLRTLALGPCGGSERSMLNRIGNEGLKAIVRSNFLRNLRVLDISKNRIGIEGVAELANSSFLSQLESLDIASNQLGLPGIEAIMDSPYRNPHSEIDLRSNRLHKDERLQLLDKYGSYPTIQW